MSATPESKIDLSATNKATIQLHPPLACSGGAPPLLHQRRFWLLFFTALAGTLASKGAALLPGMAPDDYAFAFNGDAAAHLGNFVSQGRIILSLLTQAVDSTGLSLTGISFFATLLAFGAISLAIATSVALTRSDERNHPIHYVAVLLAATHPYLTSYFIFRMSAITHALVYLSLFIALTLLPLKGKMSLRFGLSVLVLLICSHTNQAILILYSVAAGAWAISRLCELRARNGEWHEALSGIRFVVATLALASMLYLATSSGVRGIYEVAASETYTPQLRDGIGNTLRSAATLAYGVAVRGEPLMALWLKIWLASVIAVTILLCVARERLRALAAVIFLGLGLIATVSPLALSWGGHVPRAFSSAGLCFALVLCIASADIRGKSNALASAMIVPLILTFCAIGATLFYQQSLLTRWDQYTAASIYTRALEIDSEPRLRIAPPKAPHSRQQSMVGQGINESALIYPWAFPGLFSVATGERLDIAEADRTACNGIDVWPAPSSLERQEDGSILVCMAE